jgi:sortase A
MATTRPRTGSRSRGKAWVAVMLVVAAGAVAWFGPGINGGPPQRSGSAVTIPAGAPLVTEPMAVISPLQTGSLPTRIVVAAAAIDAPIAEVGVVMENGEPTWETAWQAVGHHLDSALPGQPGNLVLTGHVSVADRRNLAAFAHLDIVRAGDIVDVYSGDAVYHYRVDRITVVAPASVQVLRSTQASTVTLITCTKDLKNRLIVTGTLV